MKDLIFNQATPPSKVQRNSVGHRVQCLWSETYDAALLSFALKGKRHERPKQQHLSSVPYFSWWAERASQLLINKLSIRIPLGAWRKLATIGIAFEKHSYMTAY